MSAMVYYAKAKVFTDWVNTHISMIQAEDIVEISGMDFGTLQEGLMIGTRDNYGDSIKSDFQNLTNFNGDKTYIFGSNAFESKRNGGIYCRR